MKKAKILMGKILSEKPKNVNKRAQIYVGRWYYQYGKAEDYQLVIDDRVIVVDNLDNLFPEGSFNQGLANFTAKLLYTHEIKSEKEYEIVNGLKYVERSDICFKREKLEPYEISSLERTLKRKLEELSCI